MINDTASQIIVVVPSETAVGEPFDIRVTVRDRHENVVYDYDGYVSVEVDGFSSIHNFGSEDKGSYRFHGCVLNSPGTYRIRAEGSGGLLEGLMRHYALTRNLSKRHTGVIYT